jgi:PleD family two-component response regulator
MFGEEIVVRVPHILIVEDQPSTSEMLTSYFMAQGYEVTAVGWGKDALAMTEKMIPDLVMLDIHLPDINGYEVCRSLRSHRRTERIPVIFLTERRERSDKLTGLELGAVDYITKPFDIQELRLRVRNALRRSSRVRLAHPITGLPTSSLSDEHLREMLGDPDWMILSIGLRGLKEFAEVYGFVARDDVVRAVALMLNHVVKEAQDENAFLGHLDDTNFFVVISPGKLKEVQKALTARLNEAMAFFYPRVDWTSGQTSSDRDLPHLDVTIGVVTPRSLPQQSLDSLKQAIYEAQL